METTSVQTYLALLDAQSATTTSTVETSLSMQENDSQEMPQFSYLTELPILLIPVFCLMPAVVLAGLIAMFSAIHDRLLNHRWNQLQHVASLERLLRSTSHEN
jgi:hypothetical protein